MYTYKRLIMAFGETVLRLCVFLLISWGVSRATLSLTPISTLYLPVRFSPTPEYEYNAGVAEQVAYDKSQKHVYVAGSNILYVVDYKEPSSPNIVYHVTISVGSLTDVAVCGNYVAIAIDSTARPLEGKVYIYRLYNPTTNFLEKINELTVGPLPDMIVFTKDCRKLVIALEGEPRTVTGNVVDPEGGVGVVEFPSADLSGSHTFKVADFTSFNPRWADYVARGVRWVWRGEGAGITNTFSQDLEPEYITLDDAETKAYVALQENNAVAVVDLVKVEVTEIYPLGVKSWSSHAMDASDRDKDINLKKYGIYGMYQPDCIRYITIGGADYILTANEGDDKSFEAPDFDFEWEESERGKTIYRDGLVDDSVSEVLKTQLNDSEELGRLKLSVVEAHQSSGKLSSFLAYGARSFSLFRATELSLAWDSGGKLEQDVAISQPAVFNANAKDDALTPEASRDSRSDNNGPEPESLTVGVINGKTYVFVGLERPGLIAVYSVPTSGPIDLVCEALHYAGGTGQTFKSLWEQRIARDLDPEDLWFIPAAESPTGGDTLLVAGSVSGTVSLYDVTVSVDTGGGTGLSTNSMVIIAAVLAGVILIMNTVLIVLKLRRKRHHAAGTKTRTGADMTKF